MIISRFVYWLVSVVVTNIAFDAGGLGFDSRAGQIGHSVVNGSPPKKSCDIFSELCCPGTKPRRWISALVTRFGVIPGV